MNDEYHGPERRDNLLSQKDAQLIASAIKKSDDSFKIFGFRIQELIAVMTVVFGIIAFYLRTEITLQSFEKFQNYTTSFMSNSDEYHSEVLGTYFRQGKPIDSSFNLKGIRKFLNDGANGYHLNQKGEQRYVG